jgi:tetratricopeptide (TPR) repeat protein
MSRRSANAPSSSPDRTVATGSDFTALVGRLEEARGLRVGDWSQHPLLALLEPIATVLSGDDDGAFALLRDMPEPADPWSRATRHFVTAMLHENAGHFDDHRHSLKLALEGYREVGERWGLATTLSSTGDLRLADGDLDGSAEAYGEAHRLMAEIAATEDAAYTRTRLAAVYARSGDVVRAREELTRAEAERVGSQLNLLTAETGLADLARQAGDRAEARRLADRALRRAESLTGVPPQAVALVLATVATLDADEGDPVTGRERVRTAVSMPMADRDMPVMGAVALAGAYVELRAGEPALAARLFGAALALRGTEERGSPQVELLRRELTAALGPETLHRLHSDGAALPRDRALGLLRGDGCRRAGRGAGGRPPPPPPVRFLVASASAVRDRVLVRGFRHRLGERLDHLAERPRDDLVLGGGQPVEDLDDHLVEPRVRGVDLRGRLLGRLEHLCPTVGGVGGADEVTLLDEGVDELRDRRVRHGEHHGEVLRPHRPVVAVRLEQVPDGEELVLRQTALGAGVLDLLLLGVLQPEDGLDGAACRGGSGLAGVEVVVLAADDGQRHGVMDSGCSGLVGAQVWWALSPGGRRRSRRRTARVVPRAARGPRCGRSRRRRSRRGR